MNVKSEITVVTERGQTSIPAHLRKELGLAKGGRLAWEQVSEDEVRVRVIRAKPDPVAMLGFASTYRHKRSTAAWMAELRAGEK